MNLFAMATVAFAAVAMAFVRRSPRSPDRRRFGRLILAVLLAAAPAALAGQGVRGQALTLARYVSVRPMRPDTVARASVTEDADGNVSYQGVPATCFSETQCVVYLADPTEHSLSLSQDLSATAWGFGVRGLSVTALLRARADLGGDYTWPRSDDAFDAILAYAELARGVYRFRVGRQQTLSGLGFSGFDGISALVDPIPGLRIEAYGGRSLARGLSEPANEALQGIEDFVPDRSAYLLGGVVELRPELPVGASARYQREIWSDRSALLSERASFDAWVELPANVMLTGNLDYDFGFSRIGKSRVSLRVPVAGRLGVDATFRRYLPYFDLWTIWGFFSPVGYNEAEISVTYRVLPALGVWGSAALRAYEDAEAPIVLEPLQDHSHRFALGTRWSPSPGWDVDASYRQERGFGATLSNGEASLRWSPRERTSVSAYGTAFQQIEEFRVGEGAVLGAGLSATLPLPRGASLDGGASLYRNRYTNRPGATDWNQTRGWLGLTVPIGSDPGMAAEVGRR